jgi:hypothetical protein
MGYQDLKQLKWYVSGGRHDHFVQVVRKILIFFVWYLGKCIVYLPEEVGQTISQSLPTSIVVISRRNSVPAILPPSLPV